MTGYPNIEYMVAHYRFGPEHSHIAVPEGARPEIEQMGAIVGTNALVAIYIPEGTKDIYNPGPARGRVVGAVRLVPIPADKSVEDYFYRDVDGSLRWPFGWPCQVVYAPPVDECPSLREHIETLWGSGSFRGFVTAFQRGPIRVSRFRDLQTRLAVDFARFVPAPGA